MRYPAWTPELWTLVYIINLPCGFHCTYLPSRIPGRLPAPDVLRAVCIIIFITSASWSSKSVWGLPHCMYTFCFLQSGHLFLSFPYWDTAASLQPSLRLCEYAKWIASILYYKEPLCFSWLCNVYSGLGSHCFNKEAAKDATAVIRLGIHGSWAPVPPVHRSLLPFAAEAVVWWLHEVWTHHPFSWLYNKSSTTVVTNALWVGVLSLAELLKTAGDSDGQSKGLTETTAQQWGWTDEKLPRATFWISSGWLKEWLLLSLLFKASKSIVYHYAEILLCTIKMQPALHKAELSFNGIHQYYKGQQLKWYHF